MTSASAKTPAARILGDEIRKSGRRVEEDKRSVANIRNGFATKLFLRIILIMVVYAVPGGMQAAVAGPPSSLEYLVKAAFLYNFARFVEWPADSFEEAQSPFNLCVLGKDPFDKALDSIKDKTVRGRQVRIKLCKTLEEVKGCHLLFISASEKENMSPILSGLRNSNILTVSEIERFCQLGGIINFTMVDGKVHFEINPEAAERHSLKVSSQLLKLARIVSSETR